MANITVYPFGQDGVLPSGYPIADDLGTDSAQQALSARQGVTLRKWIVSGEDMERVIPIDLTQYTQVGYSINSNNQWGTGSGVKCELIPISDIKSISVEMDGANGVIAFLKNNTIDTSSPPPFATGETGRRQILDGASLMVDVPSDGNYLYVATHTTSTDIRNNYEIYATEVYNSGGCVTRKELEGLMVGNPLYGKKVSIIGDSISCFGTENQTRTAGYNAPYWIVKSVDVGQTIQSWVTWLDVYTSVDSTTPTNKTIGGVTLTAAMIGTKQTFTPVAEDVGKAIGVPRWASSYTTKPWWRVLIDKTGAVLCNNASWSGSRIIPIPEGNDRHDAFVLSEAYSEYTLKRVCNRDDEGNTIVPDVIIIYRGTNDFSAEDPEGGVVSDDDESIETPNMISFNGITDVHNFTQGYIWTILKLRELYPQAYIVLCTLNIFKRVSYSKFPVNNGTYTLPQYNDKIREIANLMGCGLIELDKDGITFENCYPTYISDNATTPTHPNTNGHRVMGEKAVADLTYALNPTS